MWRDIRTLLIGLLVVGIATFGVPVLLFGGFYAYRIGGEYLARTDFDATTWQKAGLPANAPSGDPIRIRMVDDLLDRHDLRGMTRAEVTALLGEPDDAALGQGDPLFHGWDMAYYLGPERGLLALDSEFLVLRLGADQRVSELRVITS